MTRQVQYVTIDADQAGQRIDNFLIRQCKGVPKSHLYKAIRSGQVRVNKGRIRQTYRLQVDDVIRIPPMSIPAPDTPVPVPPANFPVVYEDNVLLAINKPAGVAVHGGSGLSFGVIEQLRAARPDLPYLELAHRLDRDTSGVLLLAKRRSALRHLHQSFRQRLGRRLYDAMVVGDWVNDRQHLRQPLLRWSTPHGERRVKVDESGKAAHTIITLRERFGRYSHLTAELRTGRTHQIRVHLAAAGFPVLCDDKYGPDEVRERFAKCGYKRMFLHASELQLPHPQTQEIMVFQAPLPEEFNRLMKNLASERTT